MEMSAAEKRMIRALQLLVAFEGRKILSYIWDSNAPEGTVADESIAWPVSLKVKVLTLEVRIFRCRQVVDSHKKCVR